MSFSVTKLVNGEYRDYSKYVLYSRAIPHMIDGLKPSQRKILYTASTVAKSRIKTASLSGATIAKSNYHHGDASLNEAITKMVQPFVNNEPLLDGEGSFGSRLVPEAAAPRYTYVKLGKNYSKYFVDNEVTEVSPDPEDPEPKFYLPILPWVLVNGIKGIAVGFSTEIQPHSIKDISKLCVKHLSGKKITNSSKSNDLLPSYPNFKGKIYREEENIMCSGIYKRVGGTKLLITEVPIGFTRESYVQLLDKLEDAGKIVSYTDKCDKSGFNFDVTLKRGQKDSTISSTFRMTRKLNQNLTVINQRDELCVYDSVQEIIADFCDYRLTKYADRYAFYIKEGQKKLSIIKSKIRFIMMILEGELNFKGKTRKQIEKDMMNIDSCRWGSFDKDIISTLISLPIYSLCEDEKNKLEAAGIEIFKKISLWKNIDINEEFIKELKRV